MCLNQCLCFIRAPFTCIHFADTFISNDLHLIKDTICWANHLLRTWATTLEYFAVALSKTYFILSLLYLINTHMCVQVWVGCVRFSRQVSSAFPSAAGDWGGEYWQAEGSHATLGTVPHQRPEPKLAVHLPPGTQGCSRSCRWRTVTKLELHGYNKL